MISSRCGVIGVSIPTGTRQILTDEIPKENTNKYSVLFSRISLRFMRENRWDFCLPQYWEIYLPDRWEIYLLFTQPPKQPKRCGHKQTLDAPAAGLFAGGAASTVPGRNVETSLSRRALPEGR